ncbi:MAG: tRNA epoxyqueuosine(34) reductase QueG [Bdellovibrionota bacterium]
MNGTVSFEHVRSCARELGLELAGALTHEHISSSLRAGSERLATWQQLGHAGEMAYMNRPSELFSSLDSILPGAKSVLVFLVPYRSSDDEQQLREIPNGWGRVARYAWGRDYHRTLKKQLKRFVERVRADLSLGDVSVRVFSDAVPLLERTVAQGSGLGFIGKNSMLIRPKVGSFTFLCEVVWDVALTETPLLADHLLHRQGSPGSKCGRCTRCISACPTDALSPGGFLDARRCISYLTIEKKTELTDWEAEAIGPWVFGCDLCQEVCPFNHGATARAVLPEFSAEVGGGVALNLLELLRLDSDEKFANRFTGTALMRAGRAALVRNACAVLANTLQVGAIEALRVVVDRDPSLMVRNEAARSLSRLAAGERRSV